MTDFTSPLPHAHPLRATELRRILPRPALAWLLLLAAGATGCALGSLGHATAAPEASLALLLRFMAVLKAGAAVGAAALLHWRLRTPVTGGIGAGYLVALAAMALAPGLIASLHHVAAGALVFHAGLFGFLVLALADDRVATVFGARRS